MKNHIKNHMKKGGHTIDRFEEGFAVLEDSDGNLINVERAEIPEGAKEGDRLIFDGDRLLSASDESEKIRKDMKRRFDALVKKSIE